MAREVKKSYDFLWIGIIAGALAPLLTSYLYYLTKNVPGITYQAYLEHIIGYGIMTQILSICMFGNLGVFFLFIWSVRYKAARGVIMSTLVYALITFAYKIFF